MNDLELRNTIIGIIGSIAPDADLDALGPREDLRDAIDIDSMDFLNILVAIHDKTGVEVPERDYPEVTTLDALVAYVRERL